MYLDQGEEMNLERNLNNYLTMASQVVRQVRSAFALVSSFYRAASGWRCLPVTNASCHKGMYASKEGQTSPQSLRGSFEGMYC